MVPQWNYQGQFMNGVQLYELLLLLLTEVSKVVRINFVAAMMVMKEL